MQLITMGGEELTYKGPLSSYHVNKLKVLVKKRTPSILDTNSLDPALNEYLEI